MSRLINKKEAFLATSGNSTKASAAGLPEARFAKFWLWFFRSGQTKAGWRRLANKWALLHIVVGFFLTWIVKADLKTSASTVLLPLVGVIVGLSFAWAGNAQSLLQTPEIDDLDDYIAGGIPEFIFIFQTAILAILTSAVLWGLAGLGVFDHECFWKCSPRWYFAASTTLYGFLSLTIRECWHVVLGAQGLLLMRLRKKRIDKG